MLERSPTGYETLRGGLYAITPGGIRDDAALIRRVEAALQGGAAMLQYRDKTAGTDTRERRARALQALCRAHETPLIVNDDVGLAARAGAAGVHLGREDAQVSRARAVLGDDAVIGVSAYNDFPRARRLRAAGADYIAFGSFFPSPTKPGAVRCDPSRLSEARALDCPLVAIGGITVENGAALVAAGADFLAVIAALFDAPDVRQRAREFQQLFGDRQ